MANTSRRDDANTVQEAAPTPGKNAHERAYYRYLRGVGKFTIANFEALKRQPDVGDIDLRLAEGWATGAIGKPRPAGDSSRQGGGPGAATVEKFIPSFNVITPSTAALRPRPAYLIPGIVKPGEVTVWYGQPKSNKSSLLGDAYMHASLGWNWMGRELKRKMHCIFVAAERSEVTEQRLLSFMAAHDVRSRDFPFHIIVGDGFDMTDGDHCAALVSRIREYEKAHGPADMVAIDTLTQTFGDGNQNEGVAMAKYGRAAVALRREIGVDCHMHIIHHEPKAESGERFSRAGPKGAIDLLGIIEGAFQVREVGPEEDCYRELHCFRSNTIASGRILSFSYDVVPAGVTVDEHTGDDVEIDDIVCKPVEFKEFGRGAEGGSSATKGKKLTDIQAMAKSMLDVAMDMRAAARYEAEKSGIGLDEIKIDARDWRSKTKQKHGRNNLPPKDRANLDCNVSKALALLDSNEVVEVDKNDVKILKTKADWTSLKTCKR